MLETSCPDKSRRNDN